jgi:uncharacterized protein YkwD
MDACVSQGDQCHSDCDDTQTVCLAGCSNNGCMNGCNNQAVACNDGCDAQESSCNLTCGDGDGDGDGDGTGNEVPSTSYCQSVSAWDSAWSAAEVEVLNIVNQVRASGYDCASGYQPPAPPVTMNPNLRCAARVHSKDMGDNNFFDHTSQTTGTNPGQRMSMAGYNFATWGENIAAGNSGAQATMNQWLGSQTGHCENLMSPNFDELGVGYYYAPNAQYSHYWTQNFGRQ